MIFKVPMKSIEYSEEKKAIYIEYIKEALFEKIKFSVELEIGGTRGELSPSEKKRINLEYIKNNLSEFRILSIYTRCDVYCCKDRKSYHLFYHSIKNAYYQSGDLKRKDPILFGKKFEFEKENQMLITRHNFDEILFNSYIGLNHKNIYPFNPKTLTHLVRDIDFIVELFEGKPQYEYSISEFMRIYPDIYNNWEYNTLKSKFIEEFRKKDKMEGTSILLYDSDYETNYFKLYAPRTMNRIYFEEIFFSEEVLNIVKIKEEKEEN